ncbi:flagellum-specific ATP synthase [Kluyvera cryocrescens]|uniref:Flagellum-specific ATP synthase n=1 Tax=Kluyvera cryocrescens TaxID=580 RepID=A0A485APL7_KLUCR|nr:flagellum-specific ATP synthase [Kluyvera cryocrescens]
MMEAQVVGFDREVTYLMPFKQPSGLIAGARVFPAGKSEGVMIGDQWLGARGERPRRTVG